MILFFNFAPIEFMGGAEKWFNYTAQKVSTYEKTKVISINAKIANIYGLLILKRKYDARARKSEIHNHLSLDLNAFIPFTKNWKETRKLFAKARIIYTRYEALEIIITFYYSGVPGVKKIIAGVHSPFIYSDPISFFDKLHNAIYASRVYKYIFKQVKKVHVLNIKDAEYFTDVCKLQNLVYVPNGAIMPSLSKENIIKSKKYLYVLFVGELCERKGIDVLINIIESAPADVQFTIVGDGRLKNKIDKLSEQHNNIDYLGHVNKNKLVKLYKSNDILILPSRAESMSLALLEAMSYGLTIVDSTDVALNLNENVEFSCSNRNIYTYLDTLNKLQNLKKVNKLNRRRIKTYFKNNFSFQITDPKLFKNVFEISPI